MKRQPDTAIAARRAIEPTLTTRQAFIREQLGHYRTRYGCWPTGLELLRFITATVASCRHFDVNSVRPRLFELAEQGYVGHGVKRACAVSGKVVYTWVVTEPQAPAYADLSQARQVELF